MNWPYHSFDAVIDPLCPSNLTGTLLATYFAYNSKGNINQTNKAKKMWISHAFSSSNKSQRIIRIHCMFSFRCKIMHRNVIILVLLGVVGFSFVSTQLFCSDLLKRNRTKFYPFRHCQRSNQTRIAAKNVANLEKCIQFTEYHQGLAFNFGHGKRPRKKSDQNDLLNLFDVQRDKEMKARNETKMAKEDPDLKEQSEPYFNCEVFSCPEVGNMSSMINDTRYDYYTLYGNGKLIIIKPCSIFCHPICCSFRILISSSKCNMFSNGRTICLLLCGANELYWSDQHMHGASWFLGQCN